MTRSVRFSQRITALLVFGRLPLVFGGMLCAVAVMWTASPALYLVGVVFLFTAMTFDLVDGWFAARYYPHPQMAQLADRILDKLIYAIIFPLVAVGCMWRLHRAEDPTRTELLHAVLVLFLAITVLVRDNFAHFMRGVALRYEQEPEYREFTRLRTAVAAPVGALLYAYAFYIPEGPTTTPYRWIAQLGEAPLRTLFFIEILFLVINFGSIAATIRRYGNLALDDLCLGDERLRRKILSFFPNALTLMNASMGLLALLFAHHDRFREASLFLIGAAFFDKLDGALARRLGLNEPLPGEEPRPRKVTTGALLDDIADAVSFCIVPAWMLVILLDRSPAASVQALPAAAIGVVYAAAGILRLVYFTLDKNPVPGFFKGMPTPAGALLVAGPMVLAGPAAGDVSAAAVFWAWVSAFTFVGAALLMNLYPVRYLHAGRFMSRHPWFGRATFALLISIFTPFYGYVLFLFMLAYAASPLFTGHLRPTEAGAERPPRPAQAR
ncbi:MAG: CDP-alcohol phosphatidyltransferase family protein [Desulfobacterales bacterium]